MSPKSEDPKAIYSRNPRPATVGIRIAFFDQLETGRKWGRGGLRPGPGVANAPTSFIVPEYLLDKSNQIELWVKIILNRRVI
jgi:hypothetical protein